MALTPSPFCAQFNFTNKVPKLKTKSPPKKKNGINDSALLQNKKTKELCKLQFWCSTYLLVTRYSLRFASCHL